MCLSDFIIKVDDYFSIKCMLLLFQIFTTKARLTFIYTDAPVIIAFLINPNGITSIDHIFNIIPMR